MYHIHYSSVVKWLLSLTTGILAILEPTFPFIIICLFAILIDCFSAYRLSQRIRRRSGKASGKFKSRKASKIFATIIEMLLLIIMAYLVDTKILTMFDGLHLANYVAAVFCFVQFWSILENESSCSDAKWAKVLQKVMVDKAERHFDIDLSALEEKEDTK